MCVCLFSALSRRVGALQISVIKRTSSSEIRPPLHSASNPSMWKLTHSSGSEPIRDEKSDMTLMEHSDLSTRSLKR